MGDEGMLSQRDACGSCGFVGVRGGGSRDSERVAMRSRDGRGRGGVIFRRGVCACEEVVESVRACVVRAGWGPAETKLDVDAYEEREGDEDDGNGNGAVRWPSAV